MVKKQLIMEKALELFAKQGFEATSVQQITEHCGISKGAFYLSFKSKDELIYALIDHFMMHFISDIDCIVKSSKDDSKLLHEFYFATFNNFYQHSDFAKIFIKEQTQTFNEEIILKLSHYDRLLNDIILSMIERLYGQEIQHIKLDLIYCIKGFMKTYSELFLLYNLPLDLKLLANSLVEKTNLLAKHTKIAFISQELAEMFKLPVDHAASKEEISEKIAEILEEMEESIEKESLTLLKEHLLEPNLSPAIVKGLLENIRNHPHCKWVSYLLREYYRC